MGVVFSLFSQEEDVEEEEQERLKRWRPAAEHVQLAALRRKKQAKTSEDSEDGSAGHPDDQSASSAAGPDSESSADDHSNKGDVEVRSKGSDDGESSTSNSEKEEEQAVEVHDDMRRKKTVVVRMEFDPLLSLHEPLEKSIEEPAQLWANMKRSKKVEREERSVLDSAIVHNRGKAKAVADWMAENEFEDCNLFEVAAGLGEDPDELRYAITACKRFEVDEESTVHKTFLQRVFDAMESDIETVNEVLEKLAVYEADEEDIKDAVEKSGGELRLKLANHIQLLERVDLQAELRHQRALEKNQRLKEKEEKRKARAKRGRKAIQQEDEEDDDDDSSEEGGGGSLLNKDAERKALAFRRLQVQQKIEEFLKIYTRGQNLQKINARGRRYNRRVYVDTTKRALVIQGARGPSFFPFVNMKEIDIDTSTNKDGRVETHVICAMEKAGRIYRELILVFPDQQKANTFVNCLTLFSQALRNGASKR